MCAKRTEQERTGSQIRKINHIFAQFVYIRANTRCRTSSFACLNCFSYIFFVFVDCVRRCMHCVHEIHLNVTHFSCLIIIIHRENGRRQGEKKTKKPFSPAPFFVFLYCFSLKIIFTFKFKTVGDVCVWEFLFILSACLLPCRCLFKANAIRWPASAGRMGATHHRRIPWHSCAMNSCELLRNQHGRRQMGEMVKRTLKCIERKSRTNPQR